MTHRSETRLGPGDKGALCVGALGVVFGDIGTSPLYTMRECVAHIPSGGRTEGVLGVLSLIFWSLVMVVSVKYLWYVMTADNHGEGGIFALLALIHGADEVQAGGSPRKRTLGPAVIMILIGAALLYGDGVITPAISVLGAAEGFNLISPVFTPYVPGLACVILAALFWFQHKGTKSIGGVFGPVMLTWFAAIGALGAWYLFRYPEVLRALNPRYGLALLHHPPAKVAILLGSVVLAITGAEALYADMGHFGRRYIALAWYGVAFPGLVLNYFGQGAYILSHPVTTDNPFFAMAPAGVAQAALTGLSIVAAIIASQALISGAYSLTRQAIQLGYFPRLKIVYTNADQSGQIYVPFVNTALAIGCILTAALFGSSGRLASAYGIAVTGTMAITTMAYFIVARRRWRWPIWEIGPLCAVFLAIDLGFFLSNALKLADGGWFPLAIGAAVLAVMHTWKTGRDSIFRVVYENNLTEGELTKIAVSKYVVRVPGAAIFMVGSPEGTPVVLLHHVKANRCLHESVILMCIVTEDIPVVPEAGILQLREIGAGIWRANGHYGYMQSPDVSDLVGRVRAAGVKFNTQGATYFFNREMILHGGNTGMWEWEKSFYGFLSRNARPAKDYYQIPPSQI
ncbi:MAG TPA: KUP/HAK/KT family potassium transporter, partial [Opitutaceae bacterium]|nr:KUP/HAK/KT family potassium transporter [Opitutaceae bacterium]